MGPFLVGVAGLVGLSSRCAESRPAVPVPGSASGVNHGRAEAEGDPFPGVRDVFEPGRRREGSGRR
ncbi:hypothetical protein, partial [Streptomyces resistomycificus]|uniref:hypothetical protein n=1 Tax=Streptomyces resistomycificus TaxID=67356 RepID=UPI001AE0A55D